MRWLFSIAIGSVIWLAVLFVVVGPMSWAAGRPGSLEKGVMTGSGTGASATRQQSPRYSKAQSIKERNTFEHKPENQPHQHTH